MSYNYFSAEMPLACVFVCTITAMASFMLNMEPTYSLLLEMVVLLSTILLIMVVLSIHAVMLLPKMFSLIQQTVGLFSSLFLVILGVFFANTLFVTSADSPSLAFYGLAGFLILITFINGKNFWQPLILPTAITAGVMLDLLGHPGLAMIPPFTALLVHAHSQNSYTNEEAQSEKFVENAYR